MRGNINMRDDITEIDLGEILGAVEAPSVQQR